MNRYLTEYQCEAKCSAKGVEVLGMHGQMFQFCNHHYAKVYDQFNQQALEMQALTTKG